jgi:uncharacterized protein YneF (UPF0154 family)
MNQINNQPVPTLPRPSVKPVLLSFLILVSGIIIGAGLTFFLTRKIETKPMRQGPEHMSRRTVNRIVRELRLSPDQREQLSPIINEHMKAIDEIRSQARPKISKQLQDMNEQILGILNEHQKELWQERVQQMQERFQRTRHRRGPRDGRRMPPGPEARPDRPPPPPADSERIPLKEKRLPDSVDPPSE